jgi:hypothetical protein
MKIDSSDIYSTEVHVSILSIIDKESFHGIDEFRILSVFMLAKPGKERLDRCELSVPLVPSGAWLALHLQSWQSARVDCPRGVPVPGMETSPRPLRLQLIFLRFVTMINPLSRLCCTAAATGWSQRANPRTNYQDAAPQLTCFVYVRLFLIDPAYLAALTVTGHIDVACKQC